MSNHIERDGAEARFREVFAHLGAVAAYARRRGSADADGLAAEVMTIAWRRLADVPADDARPWLYATARNLLLAERRQSARRAAVAEPSEAAEPELPSLDPELAAALRSLSPTDREALLLIAWEELTPTEAARALGVDPTAFRVRLLRARRRLRARLDEPNHAHCLPHLDVEGT
jgi:RNA polymerase sigma-70 factor (ECF subfamily)